MQNKGRRGFKGVVLFPAVLENALKSVIWQGNERASWELIPQNSQASCIQTLGYMCPSQVVKLHSWDSKSNILQFLLTESMQKLK